MKFYCCVNAFVLSSSVISSSLNMMESRNQSALHSADRHQDASGNSTMSCHDCEDYTNTVRLIEASTNSFLLLIHSSKPEFQNEKSLQFLIFLSNFFELLRQKDITGPIAREYHLQWHEKCLADARAGKGFEGWASKDHQLLDEIRTR